MIRLINRPLATGWSFGEGQVPLRDEQAAAASPFAQQVGEALVPADRYGPTVVVTTLLSPSTGPAVTNTGLKSGPTSVNAS
jgi:hypothetical protein